MVAIRGPGASAAVARTPTTVLHVSSTGSDANSGRSWHEAKLTILSAYDALPVTTGGTILLSGEPVLIGGPGLRFYGPRDPMAATPLAGWRLQKDLRLIGVGTGNHGTVGGEPQVRLQQTGDDGGPVIWLSGTEYPFVFENLKIQYPTIAVRVGVASDLSDRAVHCSAIRFENCQMQVDNTAGKGPTIDLGHTFWLRFRSCNISGNFSEAIDSDKRAAVLADSGGGGSPSFWMEDCNLSNGGIRYRRGPSNWGFTVKNGTLEGNFVDPVPPFVDILNGDQYGRVYLENLETADAPGSEPVVRVNKETPLGSVLAVNCGNVEGPATVIGRSVSEWIYSARTPAGLGQVGFWCNRLAGQHDSARRGFGPTLVRYANLAPHDPNDWPPSGLTVVSGPNGIASSAGHLTSSSGTADYQIYRAGITPEVGEWIVAGIWMRGTTATAARGGQLGLSGGTGSPLFENGTRFVRLSPPLLGDGEWEWVANAGKVTNAGTGGTELIFSLFATPEQPTDYYGPVLFRVAASSASDNEVAEIVQHLQSYPLGAAAGDTAMMPGQKLYVGGRPIFATGAGHTVDELVTVLQTLGLVRQS